MLQRSDGESMAPSPCYCGRSSRKNPIHGNVPIAFESRYDSEGNRAGWEQGDDFLSNVYER